MGFDFIMTTPLLLIHSGFLFVFGCGVSFSDRFFHGCSAVVNSFHLENLMAQWVKNLPAMQETQETWV